jgi:hypothetical protein
MKSFSNLEQRVHKSENPKKGKFYFGLTGLFVLGMLAIFGGLKLYSNTNPFTVSADEIATPPVPAEPAPSATPVTPSNPNEDADKQAWETTPGNIYVKNGWSMISGAKLEGYDISVFEAKKIILYSFNDPHFPIRQWVTSPVAEADKVKYNSLVPSAPLGYYIYNPLASQKLTLTKLSTVPENEKILARGWHLIYWDGEAAKASTIFSNLFVTYSDGTKKSFSDLAGTSEHKASDKFYVVVDESSLVATDSTKELQISSSDVEIPAKSYVWIYLRRTVARATDISFGSN